MNGNYYQNPTFPTIDNATFEQGYEAGKMADTPMEQSYIENILRLNKGKRVNAYVSYPDSSEWQNKIYSGTIEEAGKDHLIIKDPTTGNWYLIRLIYLNYVEFMEPIVYSHLYSEKTY